MEEISTVVRHVPVSSLRFTQASISERFRSGRYSGEHSGLPISTLVGDLHTGRVQIGDDFLVLDVVEYEGRLRSLRNRRLWCLKEYALQVGTDLSLPVRVWPLRHGVLLLPEGCDVKQKFFRQFEGGDGTRVVVRSSSRASSRSMSRGLSRSISRQPSRSKSPGRSLSRSRVARQPGTPRHREEAAMARLSRPVGSELPVFIPTTVDGYSRCKDALGSWLKDGGHFAVACDDKLYHSAFSAKTSFSAVRAQVEAKALHEEQKETDSSNLLDLYLFASSMGDPAERRGALAFAAPASAADLAQVFGLRPDKRSIGEVTIYINGIVFGILGGAFHALEEKLPGVRIESKSGTGGFLNRVTNQAGNGYLMISGPHDSVFAAVHVVQKLPIGSMSDAATMSIPNPDGHIMLAALQCPLKIMLDHTPEKVVKRVVLLADSMSDLDLFAASVLRGPVEAEASLKPGSVLADLILGVSQATQESTSRGSMSSEVCRDFQRGRCSYGERCRFRHSGVGGQLLGGGQYDGRSVPSSEHRRGYNSDLAILGLAARRGRDPLPRAIMRPPRGSRGGFADVFSGF
eukprot:TRINITY_DN100781_c0_g1_i1.p1 TRINITY_DN100781_c0_g1~~TRINITY_DN100781_c0_g1_i1.p1  ORF type:complete len:573 (-),score=58.29 TRINITY_DN100781_c0_g1_i1:265-1983(-)